MTSENPRPWPGRRFPTILQAVVLTICGALMAFFGCLGAISGLSGTGEIKAPIFIVVFIVGALALLLGTGMFLYFILLKVVRIVDSRRGQGPTEPPPTPGA